MQETETVRTSLSFRVTIRAKYHGPTNYRGTRITVTTDETDKRHRITVGWDYSLGILENYQAAISEYLRRMNWGGHWVVSMAEHGAVAVWVGEA